MRISEIFGLGNGAEEWCRDQRDQAKRAGADISEMDCAVDGTHYPDSRSPNAANWD